VKRVQMISEAFCSDLDRIRSIMYGATTHTCGLDQELDE
jgi:hypothetical protein